MNHQIFFRFSLASQGTLNIKYKCTQTHGDIKVGSSVELLV